MRHSGRQTVNEELAKPESAMIVAVQKKKKKKKRKKEKADILRSPVGRVNAMACGVRRCDSSATLSERDVIAHKKPLRFGPVAPTPSDTCAANANANANSALARRALGNIPRCAFLSQAEVSLRLRGAFADKIAIAQPEQEERITIRNRTKLRPASTIDPPITDRP